MSSMNQVQDLVTLVNDRDEVIGQMDKYQAHRHPTRLHRAISVWLFRENQGRVETLFQQRSDEKIVGAGWWGNTVCGNVWPGESYLACARRRLQAELGIDGRVVELRDLYKFKYQAWCNQTYGEREIDTVFAAWWDGEFYPVPDEVAAVGWVDFALLKKQVEASLKTFGGSWVSPEESLDLSERELKASTRPLEVGVQFSGEKLTSNLLLHYWGGQMLLDERLTKFVEQRAA